MNNNLDREQWTTVCIIVVMILALLVGAKLGEYAKRHPVAIYDAHAAKPAAFFDASAIPATYPAIITPINGEPILCDASTLKFGPTTVTVDSATCKQGIFHNGFEVQP